MRKTPEQKKAALQQRIAEMKEKVRRIERRESDQERRARAHVGIVAGWALIDHVRENSNTEVRDFLVWALKSHLTERPDDTAVAELLAGLTSVEVEGAMRPPPDQSPELQL